jgi:CheY-like chemotaxis protein
MGGVLRVESQVGQGSTFSIELPRALDPMGRLDLPAALPDSQSVISTSAVVLYIEDNPSNLQLVQRILGQRPEIRLLSATDGALGYDLACQHCPDLIVLDMHLPKISGHQVLGLLKGDPLTASIPVIALSADVTTEQIERAMAAGAQTYLAKPLDINEFLLCLDENLSKSSAISE